MNPYVLSIVLILLLGAVIFYLGLKNKLLSAFSIQELVNIALFCSLLYVSILPFKLGLGRIPFINSFLFSIPFTATLFIGIRIVPKLGTVTLIIFGQSLLSQVTFSGVNPLWWPYALLASFMLEAYFLITGNYLNTLINAMGAGCLRGLVVNLYFFLFSAPYLWHKFYAPWYVFVKTSEGIIGSCIGAVVGFYLSKPVIKAYLHGGV